LSRKSGNLSSRELAQGGTSWIQQMDDESPLRAAFHRAWALQLAPKNDERTINVDDGKLAKAIQSQAAFLTI